MRRRIVSFLCTTVFALLVVPSHTMAQQKTVRACQEEWRANKAANQARGITEKAYIAQCRGGGAAAAPTATAPSPAATAPTGAQTPTSQKTVRACLEEWRANKAANQASGITQKAYVAQCRGGGVTAAPTAAPSAPAPAPSAAAPAPTQTPTAQKTVRACLEEWRANKAANQASGITEKAYVAQCRGGGVTAAPTAAPSAPAPTPSAATPGSTPATTTSRPTSKPGTTAAAPPTTPPAAGTPVGAGQFATEAEAMARCPSDTVVWVNTRSKIYHFKGYKNYGNTLGGAYMCEKDTAAQGMRASKTEKHP
jgi:ribosomal protein L4